MGQEVEVEEDELNARETLKRQSFRAESVGCGRCARKKPNGKA